MNLAVLAAVAVVSHVRADTTTRVSNAPNGNAPDSSSYYPSISADGNVIVFSSPADDLVPGDTNGTWDVFVFDRVAGVTERISVSSSGAESNGDSIWASISADGRYVAFSSRATNLAVDPNGQTEDVFLRDRVAGTTTLISMDPAGAGGNNTSQVPSISGDGKRIAFSSWASNLVANDTNYSTDIFLWDAVTGVITRVSVTQSGVQGDSQSIGAHLSGDGATVAFESRANNFPNATYGWYDVATYAKDLVTGTLERVDGLANGSGYPSITHVAGISDDGSVVAFDTLEAIVTDDHNGVHDVYVRDRGRGVTERVSIAADGHEGILDSFQAAISGDGRFVIFQSYNPDFVEADTNGLPDLFVRDRQVGMTTRVSVGTYDEEGNPDEYDAEFNFARAISRDGKQIVFGSSATSFAANDSNSTSDVFLRDRSLIPPTWSNYGVGFPGRNGKVPTLAAREIPRRGTTIDIDIGDSSGLYTVAFLIVGITRDDLPTNLGGTLLVDPLVTIPVPLSPYGGTFTSDVPTDWWADGLVVDLQALELDPWAAKGVSFTPGVELVLGDG